MSDIVCPICCSEVSNEYYHQLDCDHIYCNDCLCRYIKDKIDDRETNIYCPNYSCSEKIELETIELIVNDDDVVDQYKKYKNYSGSDSKQYSMCGECQNICKKNEYDLKVYCNYCSRDYCFICHEDHDDYDFCPNESNLLETISEISSALDNDDVKLCPICKIIIVREEGCSSMRCKYCKVKFCWYCLQTNSDIDKMDTHDCSDYNGFHRTNSDDEYVNGFGSD